MEPFVWIFSIETKLIINYRITNKIVKKYIFCIIDVK